MKYLIIKNLYLIKEKIYKYFFVILLATIIILYIDKSSIGEIPFKDIYGYLGLKELDIKNSLEVILKVISYFALICITMKIYLSNIDFSMEYISLRIDKRTLSTSIAINFIFITIIVRLIMLTLVTLTFLLLNNAFKISYMPKIIVADLLLYSNVSFITVTLLNVLYSKKNILKILLILLFISLFFINIEKIFVYLIFSLLLLIIIYFITFKPSLLYCNTK